uniref:Uncharacterized protein n=1 Tax=Piliocolobus tephrosceles TaxID=591936 RepID=A0A8C9HHA3_9PRIM
DPDKLFHGHISFYIKILVCTFLLETITCYFGIIYFFHASSIKTDKSWMQSLSILCEGMFGAWGGEVSSYNCDTQKCQLWCKREVQCRKQEEANSLWMLGKLPI